MDRPGRPKHGSGAAQEVLGGQDQVYGEISVRFCWGAANGKLACKLACPDSEGSLSVRSQLLFVGFMIILVEQITLRCVGFIILSIGLWALFVEIVNLILDCDRTHLSRYEGRQRRPVC